jgi:Mg2+ and Co2+ transporter CorA
MTSFKSRDSVFSGIRFDAVPIRVIEIDKLGNSEEKYVTIESLAKEVRSEEKLNDEKLDGKSSNNFRPRMSIRDLKMFSPFDAMNSIHDPIDQFKVMEGPKRPAIIARPSAKCFLLELDTLKLFCKSDRCTILHPSQNSDPLEIENSNVPRCHVTFVESFILNLKRSLTKEDKNYQTTFEINVLEVVFSSVTSKLMRRLSIMKPVLENLMHEILSANPPTQEMLRKILALKQNMTKFGSDVNEIKEVVQNVLSNDQAMADLMLTFLDQIRDEYNADHEDLELLLEAFSAYLNHIGFELRRMDADISDVEDFVTIHLNSTRNKILRLSLFMEMGMLSVAFGAFLAGIWGMNVIPREWLLEDNPVAFFVVAGIIFMLTIALTCLCFVYYKALYTNTTQAQRSNFYALKNYTLVIDEVEARIKDRLGANHGTLAKQDVDAVLHNVVNAQPDEEDLIFKSISPDYVQ